MRPDPPPLHVLRRCGAHTPPGPCPPLPPPALPCPSPAETRRVPGPALGSLSGSQPFDKNPVSTYGCLRPAPPPRGGVLSITPPQLREHTEACADPPPRRVAKGKALSLLSARRWGSGRAGQGRGRRASAGPARTGCGGLCPSRLDGGTLSPTPRAPGGKDTPSPVRGPRPPSHSDTAAFLCSEASLQDGREPTARPCHTRKGTPHQSEPPVWTSQQDGKITHM